MKKLLILLILFFTLHFSINAQYGYVKEYHINENTIVFKAEKKRIPESVKIIGIFAGSIALDAIGDALCDDGEKVWGHSLQAASAGLLLASPFILDIDRKKWGWYAGSYVCMRIGLFDPIYNTARGLPIDYIGNTSSWDKTLQQINPPKEAQIFGRAVFLTAGIAIPINEFKPNKQPIMGFHMAPPLTRKKPMHPVIKPIIIMTGAFVINQALVARDERRGNFEYTTRRTGIIFAAGATASLVTFAFELKKHKK